MKIGSWDDLYATKVKPDEILYIVTNMARLHEEGKNPTFETALFILTDHLRGKRNAIGKSVAISERLMCLSHLIHKNDQRMRGWTMEAVEPDCLITNHAVFAATALCPLRKGEKDRAYFDADEFFDIVLRESDSEGNG
jgi:hypothetical protein